MTPWPTDAQLLPRASSAARWRAATALAGWLTACAAAASAVLAWSLPWALTVARHPRGATPGDLLALLAAGGVTALLVLWLAGGLLAAVAAATRRTAPVPVAAHGVSRLARAEEVLVPLVLRRLAAAAAGVAVLGAAGAPAALASAPPRSAVVSVVPGWPAEGQGWSLPADGERSDLPGGPAPAAPSPPSAPPPQPAPQSQPAPQPQPAPQAQPAVRSTGGAVVVGPGDSLWTIAERHLPPDAGPHRVADEWPRWWAANRDLVGDDPDLLHPGQVLTAPAAPVAQP